MVAANGVLLRAALETRERCWRPCDGPTAALGLRAAALGAAALSALRLAPQTLTGGYDGARASRPSACGRSTPSASPARRGTPDAARRTAQETRPGLRPTPGVVTRQDMLAADVPPIQRALRSAGEWMADTRERIGGGAGDHQAWLALGAVLQALRDRLPAGEAAQLGAQLPVLLRGLYFAGWVPGRTPVKSRRLGAFLAPIAERIEGPTGMDAERAARAVFAVLDRHVSRGELDDVRGALPRRIRALFPSRRAEPLPPAKRPGLLRRLRTTTREVPAGEWDALLGALSNRLRDRPVEVRMHSLSEGAQRIARLPLVGISPERRDPREAIEVTVGRKTGELVTHVVRRPTHVRVKEDRAGTSALEIEGEAEHTLVLPL